MNSRWNKFISDILGSFWCNLFSDKQLVELVKCIHGLLGVELGGFKDTVETGLSISAEDTCLPVASCILIPQNECLINATYIDSYSFTGLVKKTSSVRTLSLPARYFENSIAVSDDVYGSGVIWIPGINLIRKGEWVILYIPTDYDLPTAARYINGELSSCYKLYTVTNKSRGEYNSTFGVLCGDNLDYVSRDIRMCLWEAYVHGATHARINQLISYSCGNEACAYDSTVADVWSEGSTWHVLDSEGRIYSGKGLPAVTPGSVIRCGDFIFTGVYKWSNTHMPTPSMVPSITIKSLYGPLHADNKDKKPLLVNNKYVPDMGNSAWAEAVSRIPGITLLSKDSDINPLQYTLNNLYPGNSVVYSVTDTEALRYDTLKSANKYIINSTGASGISGIIRSSSALESLCSGLSDTIPCAANTVSSVASSVNMSFPDIMIRFI